MRGSSYHQRIYAFGQAMLTVRMRIGLTQAGLAEALGGLRRLQTGRSLAILSVPCDQDERDDPKRQVADKVSND